jgi:hypothetical protein
MLLEPRAVDAEFGTRSFNFAVENGHTEDFLAIYRWAVQQGAQPRLIIVGLDVAALHDDGLPDPMFDRVPELKTQMGATGHGSKPALGFLDRMFELHKVFTYNYVKDTLQSIKMAALGQRPAVGFDPDGYEYRGQPRTRPPAAQGVLDDVGRDTATYMKRIEGMTRLSASRKEHLRLLVEAARARGARVIVWLTPVHELLMKRMAAATRYPALVELTRDYARELQNHYGIEFHDFHDSSRFGGSDRGWYDATHMDPDNMTRVVLALGKGGR